MEQIKIGNLAREQRLISQAGVIITGGKTRNGDGRIDRGAYRLRRKIRGTGVTATLAEIHRNANALVAVVFDRLDLAATHRHRLPDALRNLGLGSTRTLGARVLEYVGGDFTQLRLFVRQCRTGRSCLDFSRHRRCP